MAKQAAKSKSQTKKKTTMPTIWTTLEDMALMEPDTSPEY